MFYNLKIAYRNLQRNSLYSWINVIGLATSLTVCILLALWIRDELSFNAFHKDVEQMYRINAKIDDDWYWKTTPSPLAGVMAAYPEVTSVCRVSEYYTEFFEYEHTKFYDNESLAVDDNFFTFFTFPLLNGNTGHPFSDDLSLIVSERKAKALFGDDNPIGKVLRTNDNVLFHVVGVAKDAPDNSDIQFDFLIPHLAMQKTYPGNGECTHIDQDWGWYRGQTFIRLQDDTDIKSLEQRISAQVTIIRNAEAEVDEDDDDKDDEEEKKKDRQYNFILHPLKDIHLYEASLQESSRVKSIRLLTVITIFILVIACINYVNLTTSRAIKRSKEMAVRKIMGGVRRALFAQLMRETLLLLLFSFVMATALIYLLIPVYNSLTEKNFVFDITDSSLWMIYGMMAVGVVVVAGIYPALSLSSFSPFEAFQNTMNGRRKGHAIRRALVVVQFVISFILIVATITINAQIRYMRNKDLGYERENIFTMNNSDNMATHYDVVRNEMLKNSNVVDVTATSLKRMMATSWRKGVTWQGKPKDFMPMIYGIDVQPNFFDFMNIPIVAGESFSPSDTTFILINEELARMMNMENPVGQPFYLNDGVENYYTIKGIVKNFHFGLLNEKINPAVISNAGWNIYSYYIYVKTVPFGDAKSALETAETLWKQYDPDRDFQYQFLDESFEYFYKTEIVMERLLSLFTLIAIFISGLGLFGLITHTAESKTKEIGIRKVFGASIPDILELLGKEFLILVSIAIVIAIPVAYLWLHRMLQDYAYRINLSWWLFAAAVGITIVLTLLTVGFKALRAALADPIRSISNSE
jgi:putative ABC transport system permease protein